MKNRILIKLTVLYLIAAVSMFLLLNSYGRSRMEENLVEKKKDVLYNEAVLIVSEYASQYYSSRMSLADMIIQLRTVDAFLNTRIWVVNNNGVVIADTKSNAKGININDLDETFLDNTYMENVYFKGIFTEPMLSVITTIPIDYSVKGYVCIHTSMEGIKNDSVYYLDFINISYLIFLFVLLLIFGIIYYITVIPVERMIKATKEYSSGHFDYPMKVNSHDEYRDLANTIRFMADEFKNLDDYQKKFVANVSHDFRSPLTSIKGYAEAILDGTIPYEMQNKYLEIILFESERLTKLTTNLLALNSFENNGVLLDITSFDINAVIRKTAATFEGQCTKKKIMLNLLFSSIEIYVDADIDKIQQVLYNLIDNAIKFSNPESAIKVTVEEKGAKVFVAVKDHGIGIPKESIKKIWERFYKTDNSRGKDKKGTGLGLSIAKEIITAHNENINVISTEGVGTEFIFTLSRSEV